MAAWNPGSLAQRTVFAINGTEKDALNNCSSGKKTNALSETNHYSEGVHGTIRSELAISGIGDQFTERVGRIVIEFA
jgi:hypothetical protein